MKKICIMMAALAAGAAICSCQRENLETAVPNTPEGPETEGVTFKVTASLSESTKALLGDEESLYWTTGDLVTAWYIDPSADPIHSYALREDAEAELADDRTKATYTLKSMPQGGKAWIAYGSNTGYDGCSARKVEFNYSSAQTQVAAGTMNKEYLRLIGTEIDVPVAEAGAEIELNTSMGIVGTVMRFLVYSAEGKYKDESVKSVQLVSVDNAIAGAGAAIAYNFADYHENDKGYQYWANSEGSAFSDECTIFWDASSKSITTTLTTPYPLEGVKEATSGSGVYMAVPAVKIGGYKYIVETDLARYTFDASDKAVAFEDNKLVNVLLNLENEDVSRIAFADIKGDLQYLGDLNAASDMISYAGVTAKDGGYWYAQTRDTGADWVTRENAGNEQFYTGVTFDVKDNATGETATWVKVYYKTDGSTHWWIDVDPQLEGAAERSATVTATFPDVDGYFVTEACKTKTVTITQQAYSNMKKITFRGAVGPKEIEAEAATTGWSWWVMQVNGTDMTTYTDDETQMLYKKGTFACYDYTNDTKGDPVNWLSVAYKTDASGNVSDTWWNITAEANPNKTVRKALVVYTMTAPEGYEFTDGQTVYTKQEVVTQKANIDITVSFENLLTEKISNAGAASVAAAKLSLSVDGQAVADVAAALTQYNVTLSATGGANVDAVAADGTVTMTFPANAPAKERTYELSAMFNGSAKATASFVQEAGTSDVALFTYTFGAWQSKGQYTVQFNASQFDHKHWLAVFNDLKYLGETPAALSADDEKALIMQLLGLNEEQYAAQPFIFTVEFGGAGETKVLIGIKEANTSGQMLVYNGTVYDADGNPYTTYTVNHLAN